MAQSQHSQNAVDLELQSVDSPRSGNQKTTSFKVITWNLWCIMFAPRTLSNPQRCGKYIRGIADQEEWRNFDGLIVCGFQELWAWKSGLFPSILLRLIAYLEYIPYLGTLISWIFQFLSMLLGALPLFKCLPLWYNPKTQITSLLRPHLPFSYSNISIPLRCILDNGLLLLSNRKADRFGCVGFKNHACDDSMAYKGFLWCYFKSDHCLVLNTHLQAAGDGAERILQIEEIKNFVADFESKMSKKSEDSERTLKIIACGDWNIDMTNHDKLVQLKMEEGRGSISHQMSIDLDVVAEAMEESVPSSVSDKRRDEDHQVVIDVDCERQRECDHDNNDDDDDDHRNHRNHIEDGIDMDHQEDLDISEELQAASWSNKRGSKRMSRSLHKIRKSISAVPMPAIQPKIFKARSYADIPKLMGHKFVKCNDCWPTAVEETWGCLDHILANFEFVEGSFKHQTLGKEGNLSDHFMILNEFTASN